MGLEARHSEYFWHILERVKATDESPGPDRSAAAFAARDRALERENVARVVIDNFEFLLFAATLLVPRIELTDRKSAIASMLVLRSDLR